MKLQDLHIQPATLARYIAKETGIGAGCVSRQTASILMKPGASPSQKKRVAAGLRNLKDAIEEYLQGLE